MSLRLRLLVAIAAISAPSLGLFYTWSGPRDVIFSVVVFVFLAALASLLVLVLQVGAVVGDSENRAVKSEARLLSLVESMHEGLFTLDSGGRIVEINTAMAQLFGLERDFLMGKTFWDYIKDGQTLSGKLGPPRGDAARSSWEVFGTKRDGTLVGLQLDFMPAEDLRWRGFARPVSAVVDKLAVKREILKGLYLELREAVEVLGAAQNDSQGLAAAARGIARLRLEFSARLDQGFFDSAAFTLRREIIDVGVLLSQLEEFYKPQAQRRNIEFAVLGAENLINLKIDADLLFVAFKNIVSNSLKFTRQGGAIQVGVELVSDDVLFAFRDTGIGIARDEMEHLFKPFYRGESAAGAKAGGVGLGLWIVKKVVEEHKGRVWAESELGKGSVFFISLRRKAAKEAA